MDQALRNQIEQDVKNNKVTIYMKGTPQSPRCGFSAQAVSILQEYNVPIKAIDILMDENVRQGIKEYSDWPTIPQIFINGEFVGGCDIITEMHDNGDLAKMLGKS